MSSYNDEIFILPATLSGTTKTNMEFHLEDVTDILRRTPATLNSLLRHLPEAWVRGNEGAQSWSPYEIIGHLIHGEETDWIPRAKIILNEGEARPFAAFDRFAMLQQSQGPPLAELLDTFAQWRETSLAELAGLNLTAAALEKRGRHPELGLVTLRQLLSTWVAHDLGHIAQVTRVMARQYRAEVGPWQAYLSILAG